MPCTKASCVVIALPHGELRCNAELIQACYLDDVWQVELADGSRLQARCLVNAAGAWADRVAEQCGVARIGLQPCRRSAFTFPGPAEQDFTRWPAVIGVDESFYFKPDAGQLLGSPANADPVEPQDAAPEEFDVALGIYNIEAMTTLAIRRPSHTWAGLRSFVADGDLVIGFDAHAPAFFWLAAQGAMASSRQRAPRAWPPTCYWASRCVPALSARAWRPSACPRPVSSNPERSIP